MYTDSHLHFDDADSKGESAAMIARARAAGVDRLVAIGGRDSANALALRLARANPGVVFATAGYDRDQAPGWTGDVTRLIEDLAQPELVAVGECGLDYHYLHGTPDEQKTLFRAMLRLSADRAKPVVVHSRDAEADTLALLAEHQRDWPDPARPAGVVHCFTGSLDFAERLIAMNYLIGFTGILTFRTAADLRAVAAALPLDKLLIETDSPYLAPIPHRGKSNEPAYVPLVASCLAGIHGRPVEEIAATTTANARRLFRF